jgi:hypothetical protein
MSTFWKSVLLVLGILVAIVALIDLTSNPKEIDESLKRDCLQRMAVDLKDGTHTAPDSCEELIRLDAITNRDKESSSTHTWTPAPSPK